MIVDCHTHIWESPDQLGQLDLGGAMKPSRKRSTGWPGGNAPTGKSVWRTIPAADPDHHWAESGQVDKSIVLGFKSRYLRAEIPNRFVAAYVSRFPQKLIGFAGIDPTDEAAVDEVRVAQGELKLRGVTVSPANQDFHPSDSRAMDVYAECERLGMPVLFHPSGQFTERSKLEYGRPYLLDEVARSFPKLRMVIAQLGQPWVEETIVMLGKHPHVMADVSGLLGQPVAGVQRAGQRVPGRGDRQAAVRVRLPVHRGGRLHRGAVQHQPDRPGDEPAGRPREMLRGIVERDALSLLGLV
jgi:predicted TIM-barrel fold metal-dependent hydrolase